jgi:aspartokinase/homoserine dehydrogenase 1
MKILKIRWLVDRNGGKHRKVVAIVSREIEKDALRRCLSAMQGTTDALIDVGRTAENGDENFREKIKAVENKHFDAVRLLIPVSTQSALLSFVKKRINELENICEGVFLLRELSPRTLDRIVSFGEILSTKIVSAKFDSIKVENVWKDAREIIKTDSNFGFAAVDFPETNN